MPRHTPLFGITPVIALMMAIPVAADPGDTLTATLQGEGISGFVTLTETASGMTLIEARLSGVPEGAHGFHLHETGECAGDFSSAGGHLAGDASHGVMSADGPHPGDLPNVHAGTLGNIVVDVFASGVSPGSTESDDRIALMDSDGTAVILHSAADDYASQPSGDAGDRIACGVLEQPG